MLPVVLGAPADTRDLQSLDDDLSAPFDDNEGYLAPNPPPPPLELLLLSVVSFGGGPCPPQRRARLKVPQGAAIQMPQMRPQSAHVTQKAAQVETAMPSVERNARKPVRLPR